MAFRLLTPENEAEAIRLLRDAGPAASAVLAGGTDLLHDVDFGLIRPTTLLSLRKLPWKELHWHDGRLTIGSTLPLAELESDPELPSRIPGLYTAVRAVGSRTLRHRATLGGNIARCAPTSDLLPTLLVLGATVRTVGPAGERDLPLAELLVGSRRTTLGVGELLRSVTVPSAPSAYLWQRVRPVNDVSQVGVAVARDGRGGWGVAVGGVLPVPRRFPSAEALLSGSSPSREAVQAAAARTAEEAPFVSDKRASEEYRRRLVRVLVERAIANVVRQGAP